MRRIRVNLSSTIIMAGTIIFSVAIFLAIDDLEPNRMFDGAGIYLYLTAAIPAIAGTRFFMYEPPFIYYR